METNFINKPDKTTTNRSVQNTLPEEAVSAGKEREVHASTKMEELYENILYCIHHKKIYLDSTINLSKLSRLLCTNTTYLSKVINTFFGCNLKTLLNKHRVEYAKGLLEKEECDLKTLPHRCGFASRSSFYAAFIKYERTAPTDYRARRMSISIREKIDREIEHTFTI